MATQFGAATSTDAAIISRMIRPGAADLPGDAARYVLKIFRLDPSDQQRLHDLRPDAGQDVFPGGRRGDGRGDGG